MKHNYSLWNSVKLQTWYLAKWVSRSQPYFFLQALLTVFACLLFILNAYNVNVPLLLEYGMSLAFVIDYLIRMIAAVSLLDYVVSLTSLMDVLTIVPTVVWLSPGSIPNSNTENFVRFLRTLRIMRLHAFTQLGHMRPRTRAMLGPPIVVTALVFVMGALLYYVESQYCLPGVTWKLEYASFSGPWCAEAGRVESVTVNGLCIPAPSGLSGVAALSGTCDGRGGGALRLFSDDICTVDANVTFFSPVGTCDTDPLLSRGSAKLECSPVAPNDLSFLPNLGDGSWPCAVYQPDLLLGDYYYFLFITLTSVGFGDINMVSSIGRSLVGIFIVIIIVYLPVTIARIRSSYRGDQKYAASFVPSPVLGKHVLIVGEVSDLTLDPLRELLDELCGDALVMRGRAPHGSAPKALLDAALELCRAPMFPVVLLSQKPPSDDIQRLLLRPAFADRVVFRTGSLTSAADLERVSARGAAAIFVLTPPRECGLPGTDHLVTLATLTLRAFAPTTPLFVCGVSPAFCSAVEARDDLVVPVSADEARACLVAASTAIPGFSTLAINLTRSSVLPPGMELHKEWEKEFASGSTVGLHTLPVPAGLDGLSFNSVAVYMYVVSNFDVIVLGVEEVPACRGTPAANARLKRLRAALVANVLPCRERLSALTALSPEAAFEGLPVHGELLLNPGAIYRVREGQLLHCMARKPPSFEGISQMQLLSRLEGEGRDLEEGYGFIAATGPDIGPKSSGIGADDDNDDQARFFGALVMSHTASELHQLSPRGAKYALQAHLSRSKRRGAFFLPSEQTSQRIQGGAPAALPGRGAGSGLFFNKVEKKHCENGTCNPPPAPATGKVATNAKPANDEEEEAPRYFCSAVCAAHARLVDTGIVGSSHYARKAFFDVHKDHFFVLSCQLRDAPLLLWALRGGLGQPPNLDLCAPPQATATRTPLVIVVPAQPPITPEADARTLLWLLRAGNVLVAQGDVSNRNKLDELLVTRAKGILLKALDNGADSEFELVFTRRNLKQYLYEHEEKLKKEQALKHRLNPTHVPQMPPEQPHVVMLVSSVNSIESLGRSAVSMKKRKAGAAPGGGAVLSLRGAPASLQQGGAASPYAAEAAGSSYLRSRSGDGGGGAAAAGATLTVASARSPSSRNGSNPARGTSARVAPTPSSSKMERSRSPRKPPLSSLHTPRSDGSFSTPHTTTVGLAHYLSPLFASGAVVPFECIPVMLGSSIFNPSLLSVFSALLSPWTAVSVQKQLASGGGGGGGGGGDVAAPLWGGAELFLMPVPEKFHKKDFSALWVEAAKEWHVVPLGVYRCRQNPLTRDDRLLDAHLYGSAGGGGGDGERGEYVFTAPPFNSLPLFAPPLAPGAQRRTLKTCDHVYFLVRDDGEWKRRLSEKDRMRQKLGYCLDAETIIGGR
jgi:hypothetical protein